MAVSTSRAFDTGDCVGIEPDQQDTISFTHAVSVPVLPANAARRERVTSGEVDHVHRTGQASCGSKIRRPFGIGCVRSQPFEIVEGREQRGEEPALERTHRVLIRVVDESADDVQT